MSIAPWQLLQKALPDSDVSDFWFDMPCFAKATAGEGGKRFLRGVASTPDKDLQDEFVIQKGLDLRYFLRHGYLNDDHKPGFENKVGQPTGAEIKSIKDSRGKQVLGMWLEGYLWPKGAHRGADAIWELGKALEMAGSNRRLGFSIQGKVLKREGKRILKAWIQDVAVTPSPVNTATWLELVDSLSKGQWASESDVLELRKSIQQDVFKDSPLIEEPWEEKALGAASPMAIESLEERMKVQTYRGKSRAEQEDEMSKSIHFAYREFRMRGYSESLARSAALAVVARQLLS